MIELEVNRLVGGVHTSLIGLMITKHSEKSAFLIKLCRYLLAISPRRIYFPMQKLLFANISR